MRTLREMGISSVAVYSEAYREALHVRRADEAFLLGPGPATESYLKIDKLIEVAKESGAEAIHPGYGFLAENPNLARACDAMQPSHSRVTEIASAISSFTFAGSAPSLMAAWCMSAYALNTPGIA